MLRTPFLSLTMLAFFLCHSALADDAPSAIPVPMTLKVGTVFADGFKRPVKNVHIQTSQSRIASAEWNGQYIAVKALKPGDALISITGDYDDLKSLDDLADQRSFSQTYA